MLIPIFILCYENANYLKKTIESIKRNTIFPYQLIVCDNGSKSSEMILYLIECEASGIVVYRNKNNFWILGLNKALKHELNKYNSELLVVTDDDIIVPPPKGSECWLTHLQQLMNLNIFIGKLGLGLSLENIKNKKELSYIYERELLYKRNILTSGIFASHVDTTMAIYRKDLFIYDKMQFYPGHGSYIKPYYHVGRAIEFECIHLGWELYQSANNKDIKKLNNKVYCFTICAGYLDKNVLLNSSKKYYLFYILCHKIFKFIWGFLLILRWVYFIADKRLIRMNKIYEQSK